MENKKHLLKIFKPTLKALKNNNASRIKELSDKTIHSASIYQEPEYTLIAVILYSLNKILERKNYQEYKEYSNFLKSLKKHLKNSISHLQNSNQKKLKKELIGAREDVENLSGNFRKHIEYVFKKASINKASRIYEHGVSMERTANLLGITIWDLSIYAGKTGIADVDLNKTMNAKKRADMALELFN